MNAPARFAVIVRLLGFIVLTFGLLAGAASASASTGSGWLRLAHLSPNTPPVDVYLYSFGDSNAMIVLHHVAYGTVSGYEKVRAGEYTVAMRAAGASPSSAPVLSTTVDVKAGAAYTVAGMGPAKGLRLQVLRDRLTAPAGKALVRVIQASLQQHRVTVRAGHSVLARKLAFASVTSYRAVPAGTWSVSAAGPSSRTSATFSLAAGTIHTIVVLDDPGHLVLDNLTDAAGAAVAPAGAPATGLGGMAPHPGGIGVGWLALAAAGLLLSGAGIVLGRRPGGKRRTGQRRPPATT